MMIHNQAAKFATGLVNKRIIEEKSHDVYTYGFEVVISALINALLMAIISIGFRRYYDWLLFLVAFIPLRRTAGGYHANSHFTCIMVGTVVFTTLLAISRVQLDWSIIIPLITVMSFLVILLFSPVEAHNKILNEEQRKKNRMTSIYIGGANLFLAVPTIINRGLSEILAIYFAGVFAAALSMLVAKANNKM